MSSLQECNNLNSICVREAVPIAPWTNITKSQLELWALDKLLISPMLILSKSLRSWMNLKQTRALRRRKKDSRKHILSLSISLMYKTITIDQRVAFKVRWSALQIDQSRTASDLQSSLLSKLANQRKFHRLSLRSNTSKDRFWVKCRTLWCTRWWIRRRLLQRT